MLAEKWYQTTGEQHLRKFFGMISQAMAIGHSRELTVQKVNVDEIMRAYRGEPICLTEDEKKKVRRLHKSGVTITTLANWYGVHHNIMWRVIKPSYMEKTRSKSLNEKTN